MLEACIVKKCGGAIHLDKIVRRRVLEGPCLHRRSMRNKTIHEDWIVILQRPEGVA